MACHRDHRKQLRKLKLNRPSAGILIRKLQREIYRRATSVVDLLLLTLSGPLPFLRKPVRCPAPVVVFLAEGIVPRISRTAKWIKRESGFSVVLVAAGTGFTEAFSNDGWDDVLLYRNGYHLLRILLRLKGVYLFHAFAPKSHYPDLVRRHAAAPFLIDMQDVYACYYGLSPGVRWIRAELPREKACLQRSGGVIAHSLEPNVALRIHGGKKPPTLFFPLYCDSDYFRENRGAPGDGGLHLVYAGGVAGSHRDRAQYGLIQFHSLIDTLSAQGIHFHIYPSPTNFRADWIEYEAIAGRNRYFYFHPAVPQDDLPDQLNRYHFGILPFFRINSGQSENKFRYATALKLFNYIEAGIPVIVSRDLVFQSWIVKRYDAGLVIGPDDIPRLGGILAGADYPALAARLAARRAELSLKKHIPRLLQFYRRVAGPAG